MQIPLISVILHTYNQQKGVEAHVNLWKALPKEVSQKIEFILIDDFSDPQLTISKEHLNLRLFRVTDDIDWNMPGCKNLGAFMAKSDWLLFFDVDNFIEPKGFAKLTDAVSRLDKTVCYKFKRTINHQDAEPHINTLLVSQWGFFKAGGIDEDFAGHYGYEDVHFNYLWLKRVGGTILLTDVVFNEINLKTEKLNRDTSRNQALGSAKIFQNDFETSVGKLRFRWEEVLI